LVSEGKALLELFCHQENPTAGIDQVTRMIHLI